MHRFLLTRPASLILLALGLLVSSTLAAEEKWISLFDGKTLTGWKSLGGKAKFEVRDGVIVGTVTEGEKANSFIATEKDFQDFVFECEFKADAGLNSGVQFRSVPPDDKVHRVYGYQYEIDPTSRALTGGLQEEGRRGWLSPEKSGGEHRDEWLKKHGDPFKPGEWNLARIEVRGTHIRTWLNGHLLVDTDDKADVRIPKGFFALQIHQSKNPKLYGKEVSFRNLRVQPLE